MDNFRERILVDNLISQKEVIKSFRSIHFPHKSLNLSFIITNVREELTDLCGNGLLQNDFINNFCEIRPAGTTSLRPRNLIRENVLIDVLHPPNDSTRLDPTDSSSKELVQ